MPPDKQVDHQLEFMETLKISNLGLIPGFHQGVEASLHQFGDAAAKNRLLTEEIGFSLFLEAGFDDPRPGGADTFGIRQGRRQGVAGGILVNSHQGCTPAPFADSLPTKCPGPLGPP